MGGTVGGRLLQRQLDQTERPDLDTGRATLRTLLDLLAKPQEIYRLAGKQGRRVLNQAIFTRLYLDADDDGLWVPECVLNARGFDVGTSP